MTIPPLSAHTLLDLSSEMLHAFFFLPFLFIQVHAPYATQFLRPLHFRTNIEEQLSTL